MEFLKNIFKNKDKKVIYNLLLMFSVGIILLVAGSTVFNSKKPILPTVNEPIGTVNTNSAENETTLTYEQDMEKRLEETLSLIDGAGKVKVMLTIDYGKEIVVAQNVDSTESLNDEKDNEGGIRDVQSKSKKDTFVMLRKNDGSEYPLILKEIEPQVEGVIIVAEGGDDIAVKDALVRATYTVLGAQSHKIQVLKMKPK